MSDFTGIETKQANRNRKYLPSAHDLAEQVRDGALVDDLAEQHNVSPSLIARTLNDAGYRRNGDPTFQPRPIMSAGDVRLPTVPMTFVHGDTELEGALCAKPAMDPEWWFPERVAERRTTGNVAKAICAECPVRVECLRRRLEVEEVEGFRSGIWGGLDEAERDQLAEGAA